MTAPPAPLRVAPTTLDLASFVGRAGWARLPAAVRRRFAAAHVDTCYEGRLDMRSSLAGRVFALLARAFGQPLAAANASGVPASVRVLADGRGGVVWERRMGGGAGTLVRSTKERGTDGTLRERLAGGLGMALEVFEEDGALVFRSRGFLLFVAGRVLRMPALLSPGTCRVEHRDLGGGRFRFTMSMTHALWGCLFHQSGVFADPHQGDDQ